MRSDVTTFPAGTAIPVCVFRKSKTFGKTCCPTGSEYVEVASNVPFVLNVRFKVLEERLTSVSSVVKNVPPAPLDVRTTGTRYVRASPVPLLG